MNKLLKKIGKEELISEFKKVGSVYDIAKKFKLNVRNSI